MKKKVRVLVLGLGLTAIFAINFWPVFASPKTDCRQNCPICREEYTLNSGKCPSGQTYYYCQQTYLDSDHCCQSDATACSSPN